MNFFSRDFQLEGWKFLQECVMTALDKKTVVLVTHQVEFLSEVDKILVSLLLQVELQIHVKVFVIL